MPGTLVSVRISPLLLQQAKKLSENRGYSTVQDFIRETLRREIGVALIESLAGSQPNIKPMTKKSRAEAMKAFFAEKGWDYEAFRKEHAKNKAKRAASHRK